MQEMVHAMLSELHERGISSANVLFREYPLSWDKGTTVKLES